MPATRSVSVSNRDQAGHDTAQMDQNSVNKDTHTQGESNTPSSPVMLHGDFDIVIHGINQNLRALRADFNSMDDHLNRIESRLNTLEKDKVTHTQLDNEVGVLVTRFQAAEKAIKTLEDMLKVEYDPKMTLIASSLPVERNENILNEAKTIVNRVLREPNIPVVRAKRLESRNGHPGLVKIQVDTEENKVKLLRKKYLLNDTQKYLLNEI